jgi:hypothetical protein
MKENFDSTGLMNQAGFHYELIANSANRKGPRAAALIGE